MKNRMMVAKFIRLFVTCLLFFAGLNIFSQKEFLFSSTGRQKLILNPSLAGSSQGFCAQATFARSLSNNVPVEQIYGGFDYGYKNNLGIALSLTKHNYDKKIYSSIQTDLSVSYKMALKNKLTLIPSVQASYLENTMDLSDVSSSAYELPYKNAVIQNRSNLPGYYSGLLKKRNVTFSTGLILDIKRRITFGISLFDFNQPDVGLLGYSKKYLSHIYHASIIILDSEVVSFQPYALLRLQKENIQYYEAGLFTNYKALSAQTAFRQGFNYNEGDLSFISGNAGMNIYFITGLSFSHRVFRVGYTMKTAGLSFRYLAHEFFLSARVDHKNKKLERAFFID